jgi:hypothetical protein
MKKKALYYSLSVAVLTALIIFAWEQARPTVLNFLTEETVLERVVEGPTDFELFVASVDVQKKLNLMFEQYKIEEKQKELDSLQKELELKKEEIRTKELDLL